MRLLALLASLGAAACVAGTPGATYQTVPAWESHHRHVHEHPHPAGDHHHHPHAHPHYSAPDHHHTFQ